MRILGYGSLIIAVLTVAAFAGDGIPDLAAMYQKAQELEKQDLAAAIPIYEEIASYRADDNERAALAQVAAGRCYEQLGEREKAIAAYWAVASPEWMPGGEAQAEAESRLRVLAPETVPREAVQVAQIRVEGVPPLAPKSEQNSTLITAIVAALAPLGERTAYGDMLAVSGAAWEVGFYPWSPGLVVAGEISVAAEAVAAVGRKSRWLPAYNAAVGDSILASLRAGIPVVAEGPVRSPEFGVIAALDPESGRYFGRSVFDGDEGGDDYRLLERPGWGFLLIGEKTGKSPLEAELVERALLRACYVMESEEEGTPHLHGFGALRWWADSLRNDGGYQKIDQYGQVPQMVEANEWTMAAYYEGRREAVRFLRAHAAEFTGEEAAHLEAAAAAWETAAQTILARGFEPYGEGHDDPGIAEKTMRDRVSRHQMAGVLERAMDSDREAVDHVKAVLDQRRERILGACRAAADSEPGNPVARRRFADACFLFGDYAEAAAAYQESASAETEAQQKARYLIRAAMCLHASGKIAEATGVLLGIPAILEARSDGIIRAIDRRLAQWETDAATFHRFFEALDAYMDRTWTEPYVPRMIIAHRKWALGEVAAAREDYVKLSKAPVDWVVKRAESALSDIRVGMKPVDPLAG